MIVMRETGLIVVISGRSTLHQLSLQEALIEKEIKRPCEHGVPVHLLCVQLAGREYLALSCGRCLSIKLMNLNKQKPNNSESQLIQPEVIIAFSGEKIGRMCHAEENRLFIHLLVDVLELDTSTTTFTKVRTVKIDSTVFLYGLCYVPDPHQLLVFSCFNESYAVSFEDKQTIWRVNSDMFSGEIVYTPTHKSIIVADRYSNEVVILSPIDRSRLQSIQLPDNVREIRALCVYNDQLIVGSEGRISYFSLK